MRGQPTAPIGYKVYGSFNGRKYWLAFAVVDEAKAIELSKKQGLINCRAFPIYDDRDKETLPKNS